MALRHLPPQSDMQEPAVVPHGGFLFRVPLGEGKPIGAEYVLPWMRLHGSGLS
jgi:hypothetical protein